MRWVWISLSMWLLVSVILAPIAGRYLRALDAAYRESSASEAAARAGGRALHLSQRAQRQERPAPPPPPSGDTLDLRDELIVVDLRESLEHRAWSSVTEVPGFVGAMHSPHGPPQVIFVRRASSRERALQDLAGDLRGVEDIEITGMSTR